VRNLKMGRSARMLLAGAAVAATVMVPAGAASASPAKPAVQAVAAGTTNCGTSVGGFDIYVAVRTIYVAGRTLKLDTGKVFDEDHAHLARMVGTEVSRKHS